MSLWAWQMARSTRGNPLVNKDKVNTQMNSVTEKMITILQHIRHEPYLVQEAFQRIVPFRRLLEFPRWCRLLLLQESPRFWKRTESHKSRYQWWLWWLNRYCRYCWAKWLTLRRMPHYSNVHGICHTLWNVCTFVITTEIARNRLKEKVKMFPRRSLFTFNISISRHRKVKHFNVQNNFQ